MLHPEQEHWYVPVSYTHLTEEGRSVSYISSVKKKDYNALSFTVTKGFDLLLSRYQKLFSQRIVRCV